MKDDVTLRDTVDCLQQLQIKLNEHNHSLESVHFPIKLKLCVASLDAARARVHQQAPKTGREAPHEYAVHKGGATTKLHLSSDIHVML